MLPHEAIEYLKKLPPSEPVFVLRAQDQFAPSTICSWSAMVRGIGQHNPEIREQCHEKANEALGHCVSMSGWQKMNPDKVKIPD